MQFLDCPPALVCWLYTYTEMKIKRKIPVQLSDSGGGLLPTINYLIGGPDSKGLPVNVNIDIAPNIQKTIYTAAGVLGGAILVTGLIRLLR